MSVISDHSVKAVYFRVKAVYFRVKAVYFLIEVCWPSRRLNYHQSFLFNYLKNQ